MSRLHFTESDQVAIATIQALAEALGERLIVRDLVSKPICYRTWVGDPSGRIRVKDCDVTITTAGGRHTAIVWIIGFEHDDRRYNGHTWRFMTVTIIPKEGRECTFHNLDPHLMDPYVSIWPQEDYLSEEYFNWGAYPERSLA